MRGDAGGPEHRFRILEVDLTLSGPNEVLQPILFAYRRFACAPDAPRGDVRVTLALPGDGTLRVDGRSITLVPGLEPGIQLHHRMHACLMDAIGSFAVLHAAGLVVPGGEGLILSAPSGHGKSSLTLELVQRGHAFLSDDFAPLDLDARLLHAFPRAAAVRTGTDSPLAAAFRGPALEAACTSLFGKSLVDVGQVLGESSMASGPVPLRNVFLLLSGDAASAERTELHLLSRSDAADELHERFCATEGVEILARRERSDLCSWRLRLDPEYGPTEALSDVLDDDRIVQFAKHWDAKPDFRAAPEAVPIRRREAAMHLGRELLNRRSAGRLLARYGGSLPRLFVDLAGALSQAACWRVRVGDLAATADLVEGLVASRTRISD